MMDFDRQAVEFAVKRIVSETDLDKYNTIDQNENWDEFVDMFIEAYEEDLEYREKQRLPIGAFVRIRGGMGDEDYGTVLGHATYHEKLNELDVVVDVGYPKPMIYSSGDMSVIDHLPPKGHYYRKDGKYE
jgi:hypothetical protein